MNELIHPPDDTSLSHSLCSYGIIRLSYTHVRQEVRVSDGERVDRKTGRSTGKKKVGELAEPSGYTGLTEGSAEVWRL